LERSPPTQKLIEPLSQPHQFKLQIQIARLAVTPLLIYDERRFEASAFLRAASPPAVLIPCHLPPQRDLLQHEQGSMIFFPRQIANNFSKVIQ